MSRNQIGNARWNGWVSVWIIRRQSFAKIMAILKLLMRIKKIVALFRAKVFLQKSKGARAQNLRKRRIPRKFPGTKLARSGRVEKIKEYFQFPMPKLPWNKPISSRQLEI